jgi:peroxiredoxin
MLTMRNSRTKINPSFFLLLSLFALSIPCPAAEEEKPSPIELPSIELIGAENKTSLSTALRAEGEVLVLLFASSNCPVTQGYWERIKGIWYNHRDKGVKMAVIGGNSDDSPHRLREVLTTRKLEIPLYWNPKHQLARKLGIRFTPTAAVVSKEGKVVYIGRIDDFWRDEAKATKRYLEEAVTKALENQTSPNQLDNQVFVGSQMR